MTLNSDSPDIVLNDICAACKVILAPLGLTSFLVIPYALMCIFVFIGRDKLKGLTYVPGKYWGVPETIQQDYRDGKLELDEG